MGCKLKAARRRCVETIWPKDSGETVRKIARSYNVHNSTIPRMAI